MLTNKEKKALYDKQRRENNPEYYSRKAMEWSKRNREKVLISSRKNWIKTKYGISIDEYNQKLTQQNNCCAICEKHESTFQRRLAVDHDHTTGKVRDLLCTKCNLAFGYVDENPEILQKMIIYANRHLLCKT